MWESVGMKNNSENLGEGKRCWENEGGLLVVGVLIIVWIDGVGNGMGGDRINMRVR